MADTKTLLPCPFCGGERLTLHPPHFTGLGAWVACPDCGLDTPTETGVTEADAVRYWNRRSSHEARIAELEEALRPFAALLEKVPMEPDHIEIAALSGDMCERFVDDALSLTVGDFRAARRALHTEGE